MTNQTLLLKLLISGLMCLGFAVHADERKADDQLYISKIKKESSQLIEALKDYTAEQKEDAVDATDKTLMKIDNEIDLLERKVERGWDSMTDATRKKVSATMKKLRKERVQLAEWYGGMKHSTANAWDDMKNGFSEALDSIADAWDKAEDEFENNSDS